jgi:hypothetical protein
MIEFASGVALSSLTVKELTGNGWAAPLAPPSNQTSLPEQLAANSYTAAPRTARFRGIGITHRSRYLIGQIGHLGPAFCSPRLLASALAAGSRTNRTGQLPRHAAKITR